MCLSSRLQTVLYPWKTLHEVSFEIQTRRYWSQACLTSTNVPGLGSLLFLQNISPAPWLRLLWEIPFVCSWWRAALWKQLCFLPLCPFSSDVGQEFILFLSQPSQPAKIGKTPCFHASFSSNAWWKCTGLSLVSKLRFELRCPEFWAVSLLLLMFLPSLKCCLMSFVVSSCTCDHLVIFLGNSWDPAKTPKDFCFLTSGLGARSFPLSLPFAGCQEIMEL